MPVKKKTWTYHVSHKFTQTSSGKKVSVLTQLYKTGVYAIVNNDPAMQLSLEPKALVKIETGLKKDFAAGKIKDLEFGRAITVSNETGYFEEVTE